VKVKNKKSKIKNTESKLEKLEDLLRGLGGVVIAYSGGLDSTFLLKAALDALGRDNVLAVTARSETYPVSEYRQAVETARSLGCRHLTIMTKELESENFKSNPIDRCYYCKKELFGRLKKIAKERGYRHVLDASNRDDLKDLRFGTKAAKELGIRSPLVEAAIGKDLIRKASRALGLATWSKPSFACLASRIPYDDRIDRKALRRIEAAEEFLRRLNVRQVRVRVHNNIARIETGREDLRKVLESKERIVDRLKRLGFTYVSLDLEGYRTGSMNEPFLSRSSPKFPRPKRVL
jgi:uncharacterized protein